MKTDKIDFKAICKKAIAPIARRGPSRWATFEELIAVGYLALVVKQQSESGDLSEALAVTVARRAMSKYLRTEQREILKGGWGALRPIRDSESLTDDDDSETPSERLTFEQHSAVDAGSRTDNKSKVRAQINKLPKKQRDVLLMKLKTASEDQPTGATQEQIAIKFRTSQATVSKLLKSANAILKDSLRAPIPPPTNRHPRREYIPPQRAEYRDPTRPPLKPPIGPSK